jgi:hypothetical protein
VDAWRTTSGGGGRRRRMRVRGRIRVEEDPRFGDGVDERYVWV